MDETPWITRAEAARYLQVNDRTIDRYIREGLLVAYRLPNSRIVRLHRDEVHALLEAGPKAQKIKPADYKPLPGPTEAPWPGTLQHVEYRAWQMMCQRILNKNNSRYKDYGGRGIDMDPRWRKFEVFFSDVGPKPHPDLSLDRINNDKGYWPDNVRWATRSEQMSNQRRQKKP